MLTKKMYKGIVFLNILLILGLCSYAFIFFSINKNLNPANISGNLTLLKQRLLSRKAAENIFAFCGILYFAGHILILCLNLRKKIMRTSKIVIYFVAEIFISYACVLPFALFDFVNLNDYLFPVWNITSLLLLTCLIYFFLNSAKKMS